MVEHVIEIEGLTLSFGGVPVLENVDLAVERGDFLAVLGPNGGGKSTLLKVMLGLLKPDSGTVRVLGAPVGEAGGRIGYLPQHTHVSGSFPISVLDAVRMGMVSPGLGRIAGFGGGERRTGGGRAAPWSGWTCSTTRIAPLADLSGGQKQRVFIARAVVGDPELLLLDEPTASVDTKSRNSLFRLLAELNREMTVVMVSHDISSLASGVKSVACVNRTLHFHHAPELTGEMFKMGYGDDGEPCCPVELVTHGDVPHRVLGRHRDEDAS